MVCARNPKGSIALPEIRVPLFIDEGEDIRIDTRTGEYMERA